jgi:hypothetical protein
MRPDQRTVGNLKDKLTPYTQIGLHMAFPFGRPRTHGPQELAYLRTGEDSSSHSPWLLADHYSLLMLADVGRYLPSSSERPFIGATRALLLNTSGTAGELQRHQRTAVFHALQPVSRHTAAASCISELRAPHRAGLSPSFGMASDDHTIV